MIVLVPLSRFRIAYEIAAGRPFSQLEKMILRAIQEGASELRELQATFEVHPRLLIEGLVTLTHAGWLAVGGPGHEGFVLTSGGREAAGSDRPPSTTDVSSRQSFLVMERVGGALISNDEIQFVSRRELESVWGQCVRLAVDVTENRLDEGQVQHLLPRRQGEWVRWIGPIEMVSRDAHWLPVNVDFENETIAGLPDSWVPRLRTAIMTGAHRALESRDKQSRAGSWAIRGPRRGRVETVDADDDALRIPPIGWPVMVSEEDFCFTTREHEKLLSTALAEARSSLFIASAFATIIKMEALRPQLLATLQRGVSIDLLWGYSSGSAEDGGETVNWLRKLSHDAKRDGNGALRFNHLRSGSHGKVLVWDSPIGVSASIGSYNWLSAAEQEGHSSSTNVTMQVSEPAVVAAIARCAAALWSRIESEVLSSAADRWRRIAAQLDMAASRASPGPTNAKVRLVLDKDHEALLAEWLRSARDRLAVASHKLGSVSEIRLLGADAPRPSSFVFDVLYGHSDIDKEQLLRVEELTRQAGGVLSHVPGLHAKAVVSDASACVTSYNFLSADPFGTAMSARELGLVVDGKEPAHFLWSRLHGRR